MPIYDYKCDECLTFFERMVPVAERELQQCPECLTMAPMRIKSAPRLSSKMGLDPDFPTAYSQWGKRREKLGSGKMKTTDNQKLDNSRDWDKEQYAAKVRADKR